MRNILFTLAGFCLAIAAGASAASRAPATVETVVINAGDLEREYLIYAPKSLLGKAGKHPLVIVLHGGGGTAKQIMRETGDRFFEFAERDGFYVVFPDAIDKMWDFGAGKISSELEQRIDDKLYFERVLDQVTADQPVDTSRVFATGISRGGQASWFLACEFPGRIRAIAAVAMPLPVFMEEGCRDGPAVGVAIMNGTEDPLVPYDGGTITVGKKERDKVLSTSATVALWNERNGCDQSIQRDSTLNDARDRMHVEVSEWRNCSGAPVLLYKIVGGGHTWPSGRQYLPRLLIGRVNRDIDGVEIAWRFFREFQQIAE